MRVEVVDDVPLNLRLLSAAIHDLCDEGVLLAERATKAIEIAIQHQPDLIFMDIGLPDVDGLTAIRMLKSNPQTCHIPVIVVSAHAMPEDIQRAKQCGCEDYITKPINIMLLRDMVRQYSVRQKAAPTV